MLENSKVKTQKLKIDSTTLIPASKSQHKVMSMAQLMSSFSSKMVFLKKGETVEGTVKKLTPQEITLDIGAKSEALVLEFDKSNVNNLLKLLKVGDKVKATVLSPESEEGFPVVSLRRTLDDLIFSGLQKIFEKEDSLDVYISEATRGGFFAETNEMVRGFLPNSQVLSEYNLVGKTIKVKIIEFDKAKKRVIFSEKATSYLMNPLEIEKAVKKNSVIEAAINNVTNHGLYVSISTENGQLVEGFIHISEVSYQRVENLQNMFNKGEKIKVLVIDIDHENRRVNLSIKRLEKDKFEDVKTSYKKDQKVKGVISSIKTKGITVKLSENVLGFIPEGKIPPQVTYKEGEEIEALIEDFDSRRRLVVLTPVLKAKPMMYR
ncbi:MAG: hypothetical protein A2857_03840 [Candidatus Levybacteria bacterium RIFCSPHIGHO2_01_FULL_36_15]|nr:MAG: hypothetical protein A2857_03840 [Candidatus Levybacteria bacterium RIFCSPHIGHO2_01_FULL_36_15]